MVCAARVWMPTELRIRPSMARSVWRHSLRPLGHRFQLRRAPAPTSSVYPAPHAQTSQIPRSAYTGVRYPYTMEMTSTRKNPIPMLCRRCGEPGTLQGSVRRVYDVRYMTLDEGRTGSNTPLRGGCRGNTGSNSGTQRLWEGPPKGVSEPEEDFTSRSGEVYAPTVS